MMFGLSVKVITLLNCYYRLLLTPKLGMNNLKTHWLLADGLIAQLKAQKLVVYLSFVLAECFVIGYFMAWVD
jgi:hypothetical protein